MFIIDTSIGKYANMEKVASINEYIESIIALRRHNGIYDFMPYGCHIYNQIVDFIRIQHNQLGHEVSMSSFVDKHLYDLSGRQFSSEMFQISSRGDIKLLLAPTAEEQIIKMFDNKISYKHLPKYIYQISRKYRDEIRPNNTLLRTSEFVMKDGYYISGSMDENIAFYGKVRSLYIELMDSMALDYKISSVDAGEMLGNYSEEFAVNGIEIAHIFQLGDHYSKSMNIKNTSKDNSLSNMYMSSYGVGINRLIYLFSQKVLNKEFNISDRVIKDKYYIIPRSEGDKLHLLAQTIDSTSRNVVINLEFFKKYNDRCSIGNLIYSKYNIYEQDHKYILYDRVTNTKQEITNFDVAW